MGHRSLYLEREAQPTRASDPECASADTASSSRKLSARGGPWPGKSLSSDHRPQGCAFLPASVEKHPRWEHGLLIRPILSDYPCFASTLSRETALSDFPHSRQNRLARGVISPQNGHIRCNRTSWVRGLKLASNFPRNSLMEARRRRREGRYGSISISPLRSTPLIVRTPDN